MIGLYLRLSSADGDLGTDGKDESNSIENQRGFLYDFVLKKKDLDGEIREYIDDGYSGTNFDRPAFRELLEDMKSGKIDTLITKDLSRLGRNYIEVGDYMEQVFPLLGVRYIAVNSSYDSNDYIGNTVGLELSVMNLVNAMYSKDLSKKTKSAYRTRWNAGYSTSGRPPFGYIRDPDHKGKWLIEPVAAEIVRRIFDMALKEMTTKDITGALNDDHVMTPGQYREKFGFQKRVNRKVKDEEWIWTSGMVWKVLRKYEYTGALVQGKYGRLYVGSKSVRKKDESDQVIYEGHHEAIVTVQEFNKANLVAKKVAKAGKVNRDDYPLGSVVYCGNCGLRMDHPYALERHFTCRHKMCAGSHSKCMDTRYLASDIEYFVRRSLREQLMNMERLAGDLNKERALKASTEDSSKKIDQQIKKLKAKKTLLYESYIDGKIEKTDYVTRREVVKLQLEALEEKKKCWSDDKDSLRELQNKVSQYLILAEELNAASEITQETIDCFIERVTIYDESHIEITYKFADLIRELTRKIDEKKGDVSDDKNTADTDLPDSQDSGSDHEPDHKNI